MISTQLKRVLELQKEWSSKKSPPMDERGDLIKHSIPEWINSNIQTIDSQLLINDLSVEGRDGNGNKSRVPWVRLFSKSKSPSAPDGWYVVLLFSEDGEELYLTLGHGSTKPVFNHQGRSQMVSRSDTEMDELVQWGRSKLPTVDLIDRRLVPEIKLTQRKKSLGEAYEKSTLFAYRYAIDQLPSDELLLNDLETLVSNLSTLYEAEETDPTIPGQQPQESEAAEEAVIAASGKSRYDRKPGRNRLTTQENKAIELYAVKQAIAYFRGKGWTHVEDVGEKKSYDLFCERDGFELYVEVKGTTSNGNSLVLTRNEVFVHQEQYPKNALFVVSKIKLLRGENPIASGGEITVQQPWKILEKDLNAIGFDYSFDKSGETFPPYIIG